MSSWMRNKAKRYMYRLEQVQQTKISTREKEEAEDEAGLQDNTLILLWDLFLSAMVLNFLYQDDILKTTLSIPALDLRLLCL